MKKSYGFLWVSTLVMFLLAAGLMVHTLRPAGEEIFSGPSSILQIRDAYRTQSKLSSNISMLLTQLNRVLYGDNLNLATKKQHASSILTKLNPMLDKASHTFGLTVKRWVDLFQIWQVNDLSMLFNGKPTADVDFQAFQQGLTESIHAAIQAFKLARFDRMTLPELYAYPPDSNKTYQKILTLYNAEAKQAIPDIAKTLEQHRNSPMQCFAPSTEHLTPKDVAKNIAWFQYQSRVCSMIVKNKTDTLCAKLKRDFPVFSQDNAAKTRFARGLAYCRIAKRRLNQEAKLAHEKYGSLTFREYYVRFVKPRLPRAIAKLARLAQGDLGSAYGVCDPKMLPVVPFRDPSTDAALAAYELAGPRLCKRYFANNLGGFGGLRRIAYELN